jgi:hypothetical protein
MPEQRGPDDRHRTDLIIQAAFARVDIRALAIATGTLAGLALFLATAWLLLRGAPPGLQVGPHLGLLSNYLPGYSVTWAGSLLGVVYGFLIGSCCGVAIGAFWNLIHYVYLLALSRAHPMGRTEL